MSGGPQHSFPFHSQSSNQHDASYPSFSPTSPNQSPSVYPQHPGAYPHHPHHTNAFPHSTIDNHFASAQPSYSYNLHNHSGSHTGHIQPDKAAHSPSHQQYAYPASSSAFNTH